MAHRTSVAAAALPKAYEETAAEGFAVAELALLAREWAVVAEVLLVAVRAQMRTVIERDIVFQVQASHFLPLLNSYP